MSEPTPDERRRAAEQCPRCEGIGMYYLPNLLPFPCGLCNGTGLMSEAVKEPSEPQADYEDWKPHL